MKKFIISVMVIITISIVSTFGIYTDNNPGGWFASTGGTSLPGELQSWRVIAGGYGVTCIGIIDICFEIDGPLLTLYTNQGQGFMTPNVDLLRR